MMNDDRMLSLQGADPDTRQVKGCLPGSLKKTHKNALSMFPGFQLYPEKPYFPTRPPKNCASLFKKWGHPISEESHPYFHSEHCFAFPRHSLSAKMTKMPIISSFSDFDRVQ